MTNSNKKSLGNIRSSNIQYYVWSDTNELLGTLNELNFKTALQKAKLIARFNGVKHYTLSTTYILHSQVIAAGNSEPIVIGPQSNLMKILTLLSEEEGLCANPLSH